MGRMYKVPLEFAYAAAIDAVEVTAGTNLPILIHEVFFGQSVAEVSEALEATEFRNPGTPGSGGTAVTTAAGKLSPGDANFGGSIETGNDTQAATLTELAKIPWNALAGFHFLPTPEARPLVVAGDEWGIALDSVPAASLSLRGWVLVEEIG